MNFQINQTITETSPKLDCSTKSTEIKLTSVSANKVKQSKMQLHGISASSTRAVTEKHATAITAYDIVREW